MDRAHTEALTDLAQTQRGPAVAPLREALVSNHRRVVPEGSNTSPSPPFEVTEL
jgi:hypothetical protein